MCKEGVDRSLLKGYNEDGVGEVRVARRSPNPHPLLKERWEFHIVSISRVRSYIDASTKVCEWMEEVQQILGRNEFGVATSEYDCVRICTEMFELRRGIDESMEEYQYAKTRYPKVIQVNKAKTAASLGRGNFWPDSGRLGGVSTG